MEANVSSTDTAPVATEVDKASPIARDSSESISADGEKPFVRLSKAEKRAIADEKRKTAWKLKVSEISEL